MPRLALCLLASITLLGVGCDAENDPDGGLDAAMDSGDREDAAAVDAPPAMCTPACDLGGTCCDEPDGTTACYALRTDPEHCGRCAVNCITTHRGDDCSGSACSCGAISLGCSGTRQSWCCPPRAAGGLYYCGNLDQDASNCGDCGANCNGRRADRCDGGRCICGTERRQCDGTPESLCCADSAVDIACVDTTTDRFHCGGCNIACQGAERCENGACTRGALCEAGCELGQICCDGSCCTRAACLTGLCDASSADAGVPDAGVPDAGAADAGAVDAGAGDAGPIDGGPEDAD